MRITKISSVIDNYPSFGLSEPFLTGSKDLCDASLKYCLLAKTIFISSLLLASRSTRLVHQSGIPLAGLYFSGVEKFFWNRHIASRPLNLLSNSTSLEHRWLHKKLEPFYCQQTPPSLFYSNLFIIFYFSFYTVDCTIGLIAEFIFRSC